MICEGQTSPDADRFDAELGRVNRTLRRPDYQLVNVFMIKLLLAVGIKSRVTLVAIQRQTWQQQQINIELINKLNPVMIRRQLITISDVTMSITSLSISNSCC